MPIKNGRINVRYHKEYNIKMVSKNGGIGEIDELVWYPAADQTEEGYVSVAVAIKFKKVSANTRAKVTDEFNVSIEGKVVGGKVNFTSESIQKVKLHVLNGSDAPDLFEEGKIYTFSGIMIKEETEEPTGKVASSFKGGSITGTRR